MPENEESLRRERDEARAQAGALAWAIRGAMAHIDFIANNGNTFTKVGDVGLAYRALAQKARSELLFALSQPNPGAALLERLKAAEAVCEASEAHIRCAWSGDESRVGLVSFGAYRGKSKTANSEFARTDKIDETQATAIAALAAWRKLTGDPQ